MRQLPSTPPSGKQETTTGGVGGGMRNKRHGVFRVCAHVCVDCVCKYAQGGEARVMPYLGSIFPQNQPQILELIRRKMSANIRHPQILLHTDLSRSVSANQPIVTGRYLRYKTRHHTCLVLRVFADSIFTYIWGVCYVHVCA